MKFVLFALFAVGGSAFVVKQQDVLDSILSEQIPLEAEQLTGDALTEYLNKNQRFFKAKNPNLTPDQMRALVMDSKYIKIDENEPRVGEIFNDDATIPDTFDSRQQWPNCPTINDIRDQSDCGSCWAFGAAEAISDRTCIASNGAVSVRISPQDLLSCCGFTCGSGCEGGYPLRAFKYWNSHGLVTGGLYGDLTTCQPYSLAPCGSGTNVTCPKDGYSTPKCEKYCQKSYTAHTYPDDKHFGESAYAVKKSVSAIQLEIMTNGPVEAAYTVYEDFYQYTGGVYVHKAGKEVGGHAVKIIGWGTDNGTPYWRIANSWGSDWGEQGFFRIIRGVDNCGIEDGVVAGKPRV